MITRKCWLPLVAMSMLAGCATTGDLEQTRRELEASRQEASSRLNDVESKINSERLLGLVKEVAALKEQFAAMRGQLEVQAHQQGEIAKRQNDLYADLDLRLGKIEQAARDVAAAEASAAAGVAPNADNKAMSTLDKALELLRNREFAKAVPQLKSVMDTQQGSSEAQEAMYWLSVAHTYLQQYDAAIDIQRRFAEQNPNHARAPEAMRLMAENQLALQQKDQARVTLRKLIKQYPNSAAAKRAQERLSKM